MVKTTSAEIRSQIKESYANWNGINRLYANWARDHGMTYHSLYTLYAIYENEDGCTQKKICEEWLMPKQTVSSILKDFEKKGYLFFEADVKDKRNKRIRLTDQGAVYARQILGPLYEVENTVMERMHDDSRVMMIELNDQYYRLLEEEMQRDKSLKKVKEV